MKPETKRRLSLLLAADKTIRPALADKAIGFLNRDKDPVNDPTRIVLYKDAVKLLGLNRITIEQYIQQGLLERAYEPRRKQAVGVTRESYIRLTTKTPAGEPIGKRHNYAHRLWPDRF